MRHCTLNVALYGRPGGWAMTERGASSVVRDATRLRIGPSGLRWDGEVLVFTLDERSMPWGRPIRGEVRVRPEALTGFSAEIDGQGRHRWRPMAPRARVAVALAQPGLSWEGTGYLDSNDGDEPLEAGFRRWDWCRAPLSGGETAILYDTEPRVGPARGIAIRVADSGRVRAFEAPGVVALPRSRWGVARATRADEGDARVVRGLVDAPFYARSVIGTRLMGERAEAVHESVDLDRFRAPWTQAMLPFRMPRVG